MSVHRLTEPALERAVHRAYVTAVSNSVALLGVALFLIWKIRSRWTVLFAIGPVLLAGVWNAMRRADALYRSYAIRVDDGGIWREYRGRVQERIGFDEIAAAFQVPGEGILIRSRVGQTIAISEGVSGFNEIRKAIAAIVPVEMGRRRRALFRIPAGAILGICTLIAVVSFATADDPVIVAAGGAALVAALAGSAVLLLRRGGLGFGRILAAMIAIAIAAFIAVRVYVSLTDRGL